MYNNSYSFNQNYIGTFCSEKSNEILKKLLAISDILNSMSEILSSSLEPESVVLSKWNNYKNTIDKKISEVKDLINTTGNYSVMRNPYEAIAVYNHAVALTNEMLSDISKKKDQMLKNLLVS